MVHSSYFEIPSHQPYVYEKPLVYQTTQVHQNPPSNEFQKIVSSFINEFEFSRCQKILLALTTWSAIRQFFRKFFLKKWVRKNISFEFLRVKIYQRSKSNSRNGY